MDGDEDEPTCEGFLPKFPYIDSPDEKRDTTKYENAYPLELDYSYTPLSAPKPLNLMDWMHNVCGD
jgi:hypothetical protein